MSKRKFRMKHNLRLIRKTETYNPKEILDLFSISRTTLRAWQKEGLKRVDNNHPYLFHGTDLYSFLTERQSARRTKLQQGEYYCMSCKKATLPKDNRELLHRTKGNKTIFKARCSVCGNKINRFGARC